ncbi:hypothetical protein ZWY2020_018451 [Hordeum vulgare]|nr:hypothetical protein ZWY2020_018451 [Hordeum vulgare]
MIEERKAALEEKRVKISANTEDAKMLTLNVDSLDVDARVIVQSYRYQMLQRQKDKLRATTDYENAAKVNEKDAYAAATTLP